MTHIGLLSDTHYYLDEAIFDYFKNCDEIWHAGDVGNVEILEKLAKFKPLRAVYGNIDAKEVRWQAPEHQRFELEGFRIWMTHIGGAPPKYNPQVRPELKSQTPDIFVCGHSHILRVMRDPQLHNMLYLNPGAAGREGFHKIRTVLRFSLDQRKISNLEVIELGKRGALS
ncbi:metallophosphoesterase family protein [Runella sp. MFBS21]|uniref:metallophosphoesterase family protein n=1 Tax=Runella sp. MFBS21 TaxID=3034018 RepID=UPI0023F93CEB|nr:metallophosphoesterase family protein [Runella sp. MFBS21]MDF7820442.1 metallophosphoesterase family protein [Runella sp. MFBS21]